MLIVGAKGHATEVLELFNQKGQIDNLYFFDNINYYRKPLLFNRLSIITNINEAQQVLSYDKRFVLGLGGTINRKKMDDLFLGLGAELVTVISPLANIGSWNVKLDKGLNVMDFVFISNNTKIGRGTLLNTGCTIHHDVSIGDYSEVSPNAVLLGRITLGSYCTIGANATVLPDITIGNNSIIGAGAVVTNNIPENTTVVGNPAKKNFINENTCPHRSLRIQPPLAYAPDRGSPAKK